MVNANHNAAAVTINLEATLAKLNAKCADTTGLESFEAYSSARKAVLVQIEKSRALTYVEYVACHGYDKWVAMNKPAVAAPAPVTAESSWPFVAHCPKCGETRARRQFSTCATCGSPDVSYRAAVVPTRSNAPSYVPLFHPRQTVWFLREGDIVEAEVISIDDPKTGNVGLYVGRESRPGMRSAPVVHKSRIFTSRERAEEAQDAFFDRPATVTERIINRPVDADYKAFAAGWYDEPVACCDDFKDLAAGRV